MVEAINPDPIPGIPSSLDKANELTGQENSKQTAGTNFQKILNRKAVTTNTEGVNGSQKISPAQLSNSGKTIIIPKHPDQKTVMSALKQTNEMTKQVESQLIKNGSKLTNAQKLQIKKKFTNVISNIKETTAKAGINTSQFSAKNLGGPFGKLVGMLSQGQKMLAEARSQVPKMAKNGQLNPGDFLAMQLKLSVAQLDLEFSSQALGKSSDALNKLMNINI